LDVDAVGRLCLAINSQGQGIIGISAYLSPNTVLLLGQGDTIDRFKKLMHDVLPEAYLRTNPNRWPPLHTPLVWRCNVPNRTALMLLAVPGGLKAPQPPIVSLVTGKASYNDYNSREIMHRWVDHPQRLWDAVYETLVAGVDTVVHVGPAPNLVPATFRRLSENIRQQLSGRLWNSLGMRAMSGMARRPWLSKVLSSRTALLRAPFVKHVMLEDWLLEQQVP
jgi:[acyl-carrier-protein] S-malonyltransferase